MSVLPLTDVRELLLERPARAGSTRVLAIDGPSGSGKTTLARRLRRVLSCRSVHMDAIYPGWDGLAEAPGLLVDQVLRPLAQDRPATYRRWDWEEHRWAEWHAVAPAPVLVVEGVGSAALVCAPFLTMTVWIEAPQPERLRRGLERDGEVYRPHWDRWAAQEATLFSTDRTRGRADLLIDGDPAVSHDAENEVVTLPRATGP